MSEAMSTDVQHASPIERVVLWMGASARVITVARLDRLLLGLLLLGPCFWCRLGREVEELRLDGLFLGQ